MFELLTGHRTFRIVTTAMPTWHRDCGHLGKMLELTGEHLTDDFLQQCTRADEHFDGSSE